jgi:hypothetical protein
VRHVQGERSFRRDITAVAPLRDRGSGISPSAGCISLPDLPRSVSTLWSERLHLTAYLSFKFSLDRPCEWQRLAVRGLTETDGRGRAYRHRRAARPTANDRADIGRQLKKLVQSSKSAFGNKNSASMENLINDHCFQKEALQPPSGSSFDSVKLWSPLERLCLGHLVICTSSDTQDFAGPGRYQS